MGNWVCYYSLVLFKSVSWVEEALGIWDYQGKGQLGAGEIDRRPWHKNGYLLFQTTKLNIAKLCIICWKGCYCYYYRPAIKPVAEAVWSACDI